VQNLDFELMSFFSLNHNASFEVQKVTDNVYALVGELSQRSKTNLGNNSTHGVIITSKGVVLIDSGASYLGAKEIHIPLVLLFVHLLLFFGQF
jgi:predicted acyltransferase (DUF342 family)